MLVPPKTVAPTKVFGGAKLAAAPGVSAFFPTLISE